jgi:hypothetical protein
MMDETEDFDNWILELTEDVVQCEFGYEKGEFTIFPSLWRPLYLEGLTPKQAFQKTLDQFATVRKR